MDVAIDPDYAKNGWVYLSYSDPWRDDRGHVQAMARIVRGKIRDNAWVESQDVNAAAKECTPGPDITTVAGLHSTTTGICCSASASAARRTLPKT